jgi:hypothetical protein
MKIIIQFHDGEWPIDTDKPPERSLDELLDTFTQPEVREIINETRRVFRGMCDVWNQRELAARRQAGLSEGG